MKSLVLLPSYNSGPQLAATLQAALANWEHVWVCVDGSTDGSDTCAERTAPPGTRFLRMECNAGKGAAFLASLRTARDEGFTHVLLMDADGQHPAGMIRRFMEISASHPAACICGVPKFGPDAPLERVMGRMAGNFLATLETLGTGPEDSLFGFRLYPLEPALHIMETIRTARRFDFDTVLAVRLAWAGVPFINVSTPVLYPAREDGGVTHFRYLRDNLLLIAAHTRLLLEWPLRIRSLLSPRQASA
jgi:glycosyltransferase involved in cell wall biosynthesis